jgi:hypothetical protein
MNATEQHGGEPISDRYHYPHAPVQQRVRLVTETYEYEAPFKYDNIDVRRHTMRGREGHGVELCMVNYSVDAHGDQHDYAGDAITITEDQPIVRVVVIGSACTPPGWVQIECEPIAGWQTDVEFDGVLAPRFRANNLWGMHLRVDALHTRGGAVTPDFDRVNAETTAYATQPERQPELYPSTAERPIFCKSHYRENPLAGMSSAIFEVPPSNRVIIQGGSQMPGWTSDNFPGDHHYSFRTIRLDLQVRKDPA